MTRPQTPRNRYRLFAAAIALALPTLAFAQGQIDAGRVNDASNRLGSGGRNQAGFTQNYNNNAVINNGNRIVTGNVSQGKEFRGTVGYTDPYAFHGATAGIISDEFAKNSTGVPRANAPAPIPNSSVPFYAASQTVAPPPGFELNRTSTGYVPPRTTANERPLGDQRLGLIDLNTPITQAPLPGEMITRGSLNPQNGQNGAILTGSSLYGVREWNPADPADRQFIQNLIDRQGGVSPMNNPAMNPRDIQRMRDELQKAIGNGPLQQNQQKPNQGSQSDSLTLNPNGLGAPGNPNLTTNRPVNDQLQSTPLGTDPNAPQPGVRYNLLGAAHRTSTQYTELNKRLEQYYTDRRKTDADYARDFNKQKQDQDKAAATAKKQQPGNETAGGTGLRKPPGNDPTAVRPAPGDATEKPDVKKPQPLRITSLAQGVPAEGLANVLKKAEGLMKEGKYVSALDQYDAADAVTPNNPLIQLGRANAELGAGLFKRADAHLHQAFGSDRALLLGQYDLTGMLGEERLTKLVTDLKDVATKENQQAFPLFLLGYIAYNTGHERQALGYLDLAEKRDAAQAPFYKLIRDHWSVPDAPAAKPELNK